MGAESEWHPWMSVEQCGCAAFGNPQLTVPSSTTKEHPLYIHLDAPNVFCSLPISVPNNNSELHNTTFLSSSDNNNKLCIAETCTFMLAFLFSLARVPGAYDSCAHFIEIFIGAYPSSACLLEKCLF